MAPPPPPPPAPPPPGGPPKLSRNGAADRNALLSEICKGKKLNKVSANEKNDRSAPSIDGKNNDNNNENDKLRKYIL